MQRKMFIMSNLVRYVVVKSYIKLYKYISDGESCMSNPFTLSFGKKPLQYISRITQTNQVIEDFTAEYPSNQIFMITGVRGSGKTVMMTSIAGILKENDDWIVVELNPTRDLLQSLAEKIYSLPGMHQRFFRQNWIFLLLVLGYLLSMQLRLRILKMPWSSCYRK